MAALTHQASRGFGIRIVVRWSPPTGASSDNAQDYTPGLVVRDRTSGQNFTLPDASSSYDDGRGEFNFDLSPEFTAAIPGGTHPYVASATRTANGEKFEIQAGDLIIRDLGGMSQDERTLQGLRDLMEARACGGDVDLIALSMPGGMNYTKLSGVELSRLISQYESRVAHARCPQGRRVAI